MKIINLKSQSMLFNTFAAKNFLNIDPNVIQKNNQFILGFFNEKNVNDLAAT